MKVATILRWKILRKYLATLQNGLAGQNLVATHHLNNTALNYMNMILSDFFGSDEVYGLYYLKDEFIIILYYIIYYVLLCIIMYYYVLLCIIMYYYVLLCIIMYYYVLLCLL